MSNNSESGTKKWVIIGAIVGIIAVTFAGISTFHLFGSDTQQQPIVIVKVNNTSPITGDSINSATVDTTNGKTTVNLSSSSSLVDDFYSDTSLNTVSWIQNGEKMKTVLNSDGTFKFVSTSLTFQSSGMDIGGVRNQFEAAGIETTNTYSPPFTLTTQFQGPTADFALGFSDGMHYVEFAGTSIGSCDMNIQNNTPAVTELKTTQQIQNWCTVKINVDALGTGTFMLEDKTIPISIGKGPFHVALSKFQYNPNPDNQPTFWRYIHLIPNSTS